MRFIRINYFSFVEIFYKHIPIGPLVSSNNVMHRLLISKFHNIFSNIIWKGVILWLKYLQGRGSCGIHKLTYIYGGKFEVLYSNGFQEFGIFCVQPSLYKTKALNNLAQIQISDLVKYFYNKRAAGTTDFLVFKHIKH